MAARSTLDTLDQICVTKQSLLSIDCACCLMAHACYKIGRFNLSIRAAVAQQCDRALSAASGHIVDQALLLLVCRMPILCSTWFCCCQRTGNKSQRPLACRVSPSALAVAQKNPREHLEQSLQCTAHRERMIGIREKSSSTPLRFLHADSRQCAEKPRLSQVLLLRCELAKHPSSSFMFMSGESMKI
jgi:hypothetical protein